MTTESNLQITELGAIMNFTEDRTMSSRYIIAFTAKQPIILPCGRKADLNFVFIFGSVRWDKCSFVLDQRVSNEIVWTIKFELALSNTH